MSRPRVAIALLPRTVCAAIVVCCAAAAWARPAEMRLLHGAALHQVPRPSETEEAANEPLGFWEVEWHGHGGSEDQGDADNADVDMDEDEDPPMDDEGRVLARRGADGVAPPPDVIA
jgi:hypothetical protein